MGRFQDSLRQKAKSGAAAVIPDMKRISPKVGPLFGRRDPVEMARHFAALGAPALSVVTEPTRFGGSMELLEAIAAAVSIPILRKDFITSEEELRRTKASGAAAVLLISACLAENQLRSLYEAALELGLEPLVETHTRREMELAGQLGAPLIGVNNRDIRELEQDSGTVARSEVLLPLAPPGALRISESGLETPADVRAALRAGADAVLVGTAIWQAADPLAFYRSLCQAEGDMR